MAEKIDIIYFRESIDRGLKEIFENQRSVAASRSASGSNIPASGTSRSAALKEYLDHPQFGVSESGGGIRADITYPLEIRFLDMKHLGNWRIYNRIIWRTLYNDTLGDIKYGYRDWLRQFAGRIRTELNNQ